MQIYIDGFLYGISIKSNEPQSFYYGFNDWISKKYKQPAQAGWCNTITLQYSEEGFNKFFELLDEYKETAKYKEYLKLLKDTRT